MKKPQLNFEEVIDSYYNGQFTQLKNQIKRLTKEGMLFFIAYCAERLESPAITIEILKRRFM